MSEPTADLISIIVPTFQESANLRLLTGRIFTALQAASLSGELIIVDDDSRDGTDAVVDELAKTYPIRLVVRQNERGLSGAVLRGFEESRGDTLLVMDADLSHPPERIPAVVAPIRDGTADFVIGSRYVKGGKTVHWGWLRKLNSLVATWLAFPLARVRDPMAGFFSLRRKTWKQADRLNPIGYKIGLELLVKGRCRRVVEVPIEFSDRLHGQSKLTMRQQYLYLVHLARLYRYRFGIWSWLLPLGVMVALASVLTRLWLRR